jgi:hypothetical protein
MAIILFMKNAKLILGVLAVLALSVLSIGTAQATTILDQSYESVTTTAWVGYDPGDKMAQVVTPGITGQLTDVEVMLSKNPGASGGVTLSIQGLTGGLPDGVDIATVLIDDSAIQPVTDPSWVSVSFPTPLEVNAGTPFAIVISSSSTNYLWSVGNVAPLYSGGNGFSYISLIPAWAPLTGLSSGFRTYVIPAPVDLVSTVPILQQFGMPASNTCDASAPVALNWGGAGSGGWSNSWAEWVNGGSGGAVCTRTLVYSKALGHWIVS